jgi:hypothetical protein
MKTSVAVLLAGLLGASAVAAAEGRACRHKVVELQVLGSGGPELEDGRSSSAYVVWLDGKARVLVDRASYPGPLAFADDLDCFPVP